MSRVGKFGRVILVARGGSLLRTAVWEQVVGVEALVQAITVTHEGEDFRYGDLCARWAGQCRYQAMIESILVNANQQRKWKTTHKVIYCNVYVYAIYWFIDMILVLQLLDKTTME